MVKVLVMLCLILLALASVGFYLFLSEKIALGEKQIADGQKEIDIGGPVFEAGKANLEAGKRDLSDGKKEYEEAEDNIFMSWADTLLKGGRGFREARERIAEGDRQIAEGEANVEVGERRINAGILELRLGREDLTLAKGLRIACALWALFFAAVFVVFGFLWRRPLARIFMHPDA
ncbi:MAG TPA: hypothetical protein DET40_20975 [Lentisphaeria bacterium]|nr:MAG: hypothetical protein A2X45_15595 [Lentisphaerae bacterium GWF2_50_93]HCE46026.1 hypothetical protein [Lentisphaeria bacterium]